MSEVPGIVVEAAKKLGGLIQTICGQEAEHLVQNQKTEQALVDCLTQGLDSLVRTLFDKADGETDSPARFVTQASTDPELAREVIKIFDDEAIDPVKLKQICGRHGLNTSAWPPKTWREAAGKLGNRFLKTAARKEILDPYFEVGERLRRFGREQDIASTQQGPRQRYLQQLIKDSSVLDLVRITSSDEGNAITLKQVLIELNTSTRINKKGQVVTGAEKLQDDDESEPLTALAAFERHQKMVLLGDPGSGKSTFAKELAILCAEVGLEERDPIAGLTPQLLPVIVVLRDLVKPLATIQPSLDPMSLEERRSTLCELMHEGIRQAVQRVKYGTQAIPLTDNDFDSLLLILDGLDEVPFDLRGLIREAVAALIHHCPLEHVLITCRIRSYDSTQSFSGFDSFTLDPLTKDQIQAFVEAWYEAQASLGTLTKNEAKKRVPRLIKATTQTPSIRELAQNPLMLTTMGIIHRQRNELPEQRVKLYREVIHILLNKWKRPPADTDSRLEEFLQDEGALVAAVRHLAYEAHCVGQAGKTERQADLDRYQAIGILEGEGHLDDPGLAALFLDYVDQHTGLLLGRGGRLEKPASYSFPHRIFQEYLTGCHLVRDRASESAETILPLTKENDYWAVAVELAAEELVHNAGRPKECLDLAYHLYQKLDSENAPANRANLWSARVAAKCSLEDLTDDKRPELFREYPERVRQALIEGLRGPSLPSKERSECGFILNHFGDPRPEIMDVDEMPFALIPSGPFNASEKETPANLEHHYALAQFPVSNAQFASFVREDGYTNEAFWSLAQTHKYWTREGFKGHWDSDPRNEPHRYTGSFGLPNHPVVGISWYEAMAFCAWLSQRWDLPAGCRATLPSENEWLKGARGGISLHHFRPATLQSLLATSAKEGEAFENPHPKRAYPWGDSSLLDVPDSNCSNCKETEIKSTSALGSFANGASPFQLEDMAGNVWEWTRSPYDTKSESEELKKDIARSLWGGSYYQDESGVGCSARYGVSPNFRSSHVGFRVSLSPFPNSGL